MTPALSEPDVDKLDAEVRALLARSLARLQAGGPDVDHLAVIDFAEGGLPPGEDERVRGLVTTYRAWHDAFWLHYDPLDRDPPAGETDGAAALPDHATERTGDVAAGDPSGRAVPWEIAVERWIDAALRSPSPANLDAVRRAKELAARHGGESHPLVDRTEQLELDILQGQIPDKSTAETPSDQASDFYHAMILAEHRRHRVQTAAGPPGLPAAVRELTEQVKAAAAAHDLWVRQSLDRQAAREAERRAWTGRWFVLAACVAAALVLWLLGMAWGAWTRPAATTHRDPPPPVAAASRQPDASRTVVRWTPAGQIANWNRRRADFIPGAFDAAEARARTRWPASAPLTTDLTDRGESDRRELTGRMAAGVSLLAQATPTVAGTLASLDPGFVFLLSRQTKPSHPDLYRFPEDLVYYRLRLRLASWWRMDRLDYSDGDDDERREYFAGSMPFADEVAVRLASAAGVHAAPFPTLAQAATMDPGVAFLLATRRTPGGLYTNNPTEYDGFRFGPGVNTGSDPRLNPDSLGQDSGR